MKKFHAFTLFELLIGMIISGIVIGFGYTGYSLIYKRYLNYSDTKKDIIDAIQLNSVLNNDFLYAEFAHYETDKLILTYKNALAKEYTFTDKNILRKEGELTDTFKLKATNILAGQNIDQNLTGLPVAEFSFEALIHQEPMHFHFAKRYSAETIINLQLSQWQR